jgi:hypothetical protein
MRKRVVTRSLENPVSPMRFERVLPVGTKFRERHHGQRLCAPHRQVEHTAAPTRTRVTERKPLPTESRPHTATVRRSMGQGADGVIGASLPVVILYAMACHGPFQSFRISDFVDWFEQILVGGNPPGVVDCRCLGEMDRLIVNQVVQIPTGGLRPPKTRCTFLVAV